MTHKITVTLRHVEAEPMLDAHAMSLLFGVDVTAVRALPFTNGASPIPREWVKRGRRRAREAMAHTGSSAMLDALEYWAHKDHGAALEVVYE